MFAGVMRGHSRLEGEQQVLNFRCLAVWRKSGTGWRMVAWQSSSGSQAIETPAAGTAVPVKPSKEKVRANEAELRARRIK
jgi:hypothetical protein